MLGASVDLDGWRPPQGRPHKDSLDFARFGSVNMAIPLNHNLMRPRRFGNVVLWVPLGFKIFMTIIYKQVISIRIINTTTQ